MAALVVTTTLTYIGSNQAAQADAQDEPSAVSLDYPQSAGTIDLQGRALEVLSTEETPAESIVTSRLINGELATTVTLRVPVDPLEPGPVEPVDASQLSSTTENPGPVSENLDSMPLSEDAADWRPAFAYTTSETTVTFAWYTANGPFEVWEEGEEIAESTDGSATLSGLKPGSTHQFELYGSIDTDDGVTDSSRSVSVTLENSDSSTTQSNLSPLTYQTYTTAVTYRTFIPEQSAPAAACNWGDTSYTFDGDNRSWDFPGPSEPFQPANYRTLMALNVNWDNEDPYNLNAVTNVGESITRKNGSIVASEYTSMENMLFEEAGSTTAYAQARFNHTASNPHCKLFNQNYGGSIQYNVVFRIYRSGTVEMVGWRKPVPNHEVYVRWDRTDGTNFWQTLARRTNQGFGCLLDGVCAVDDYNISSSY
ncbi:hypothetical protein [Microbacterium suaedae]|uniref:hypothetical protein n=1 Tax=Microbacterium suaedae TaxID=2067813 RepID=UPI0013A66010|nr:hypothetical protein [Microbacterium suaedae]